MYLIEKGNAVADKFLKILIKRRGRGSARGSTNRLTNRSTSGLTSESINRLANKLIRGQTKGREKDDTIISILLKRVVQASKILEVSEFSKFSDFKIDRTSNSDFKCVSLDKFENVFINDFKNEDFTINQIIRLILSKNPQLKKRRMRLNSKIDNFDKRLQKSFNDYIHNARKNFEIIKKKFIK